MPRFLKSAPLLCLLPLALVAWIGFPMYFREDDVTWLLWAKTHSFVDLFSVSRTQIMEYYRPVVNAVWWLLFHGFGAMPEAYQIALSILFLCSFYFVYRMMRLWFGHSIAIYSILSFYGLFHYLLYVLFWYSDLTYATELFFITSGLCFTLEGLKNRRLYKIVAGILFCLLAFFSKEPSLVILPPTVALFILQYHHALKLRRATLIVALALSILSPIIFNLAFPYTGNKVLQYLLSNPQGFGEFLFRRCAFYGRALLGHKIGIALVAVLCFIPIHYAWKRFTTQYVFLSTSISCLVLGITLHIIAPAVAFLLLLFLLILLAWIRRDAAFIAAWAFFPLLGIVFVEYSVTTLLLESSYALSMLCGVSIGYAVQEFRNQELSYLKREKRWKILLPGLALALMGLFYVALPKIFALEEELQKVKDQRQNFRDGIEFLVDQAPSGANIHILDYGEWGMDRKNLVKYGGRREKVRKMKTMEAGHLNGLLEILGREDLQIRTFQDLQIGEASAYAVLYNQYEESIAGRLLRERGFEKAISFRRSLDTLYIYTPKKSSARFEKRRLPSVSD